MVSLKSSESFCYLYMCTHFLIIILTLPLCPLGKPCPFSHTPSDRPQTPNPKSAPAHELVLCSSERSLLPSLVPSLKTPTALESPACVSVTEPAAEATAALLCRPPRSLCPLLLPAQVLCIRPRPHRAAPRKEHRHKDRPWAWTAYIALS